MLLLENENIVYLIKKSIKSLKIEGVFIKYYYVIGEWISDTSKAKSIIRTFLGQACLIFKENFPQKSPCESFLSPCCVRKKSRFLKNNIKHIINH